MTEIAELATGDYSFLQDVCADGVGELREILALCGTFGKTTYMPQQKSHPIYQLEHVFDNAQEGFRLLYGIKPEEKIDVAMFLKEVGFYQDKPFTELDIETPVGQLHQRREILKPNDQMMYYQFVAGSISYLSTVKQTSLADFGITESGIDFVESYWTFPNNREQTWRMIDRMASVISRVETGGELSTRQQYYLLQAAHFCAAGNYLLNR